MVKKQTIQALMVEAEARYTSGIRAANQAIQLAEDEYAKDMEAIRRVCDMLGVEPPEAALLHALAPQINNAPQNGKDRIGLLSAVEEAVMQLPITFSTRDVVDEVFGRHTHLNHPRYRSAVTKALKQLVDRGTLILIVAGAGKRPSRFRKVQQLELEGEGMNEERADGEPPARSF